MATVTVPVVTATVAMLVLATVVIMVLIPTAIPLVPMGRITLVAIATQLWRQLQLIRVAAHLSHWMYWTAVKWTLTRTLQNCLSC